MGVAISQHGAAIFPMTSSSDGKRLPLPYLRGELAASWLTTIRRLGAVGANKETGVNRAVAREGAKPHHSKKKDQFQISWSEAERVLVLVVPIA